MRTFACLAFAMLACLAACAAPAAPTATPTSYPRSRLESPGYGFEAYLWWKPEIATRDLGLIRDAGFDWVKQTFAWRDIELEKGKYDWSRADDVVFLAGHFGRKLLARLDRDPYWDRAYEEGTGIATGPPRHPENFADFCGVIAARYRGKIAAYQVWNEPNLAREWGGRQPDPAEYVALLRDCYVAIKQADPNALVISAGLAPTGNGPTEAMPDVDYLKGMYEAGAAPYFDLLGVHAPGFKAAPETSSDEVARDPGLGGQPFSPSAMSRTCGRSWSSTAMATSKWPCSSSGGRRTPSTRVMPGSPSTSKPRPITWCGPISGLGSTGAPGSAP